MSMNTHKIARKHYIVEYSIAFIIIVIFLAKKNCEKKGKKHLSTIAHKWRIEEAKKH